MTPYVKRTLARVYSLFGGKQLDEIERRATSIIQSACSKEEKQQQLILLAKEIGLPVHSSDVHCIAMSYAQLFHQIEEWIARKRADRSTSRTVLAAYVSAMTALVAVVVSVIIHSQTRELLAPTERPLISTVDSNCKGQFDKDTGKFAITLNLIVKNIGKHPAENIRVRTWGALIDEPNNLKMTRDVILADPLFPDVPAGLPSEIIVPLQKRGDEVNLPKEEVFFYVRMDYKDKFFPDKEYTQDFHLIYQVGKGFISGATLKVKQAFENHLRKAGAIPSD